MGTYLQRGSAPPPLIPWVQALSQTPASTPPPPPVSPTPLQTSPSSTKYISWHFLARCYDDGRAAGRTWREVLCALSVSVSRRWGRWGQSTSCLAITDMDSNRKWFYRGFGCKKRYFGLSWNKWRYCGRTQKT